MNVKRKMLKIQAKIRITDRINCWKRWETTQVENLF